MKLLIEPHGMRIVTENVQDVAYLKHMGYGDREADMALKVAVTKTFTHSTKAEGAEIEIKWESDSCCDNGAEGFDICRDVVQTATSLNSPVANQLIRHATVEPSWKRP